MEVIINKKKVGTYEMTAKGLTYVTHRDSQRHFFIKHQSYGLSVEVIKTLLRKGVHRVLLVETRKDGSKHSYETTTEAFASKPTIQCEGWDEQKLMPISELEEL